MLPALLHQSWSPKRARNSNGMEFSNPLFVKMLRPISDANIKLPNSSEELRKLIYIYRKVLGLRSLVLWSYMIMLNGKDHIGKLLTSAKIMMSWGKCRCKTKPFVLPYN